MSGISSAMNIALSGLNAFETGISAVSGNLANQTTPGYGVETVNLATADAAGQGGSGVQSAQVTRVADGFAVGLLRTANSAAQAASTQSTALTALSGALQNSGDVQSSINQFFLDTSTLAANPTSTAQRQTVLADAQTITGSFQSAAASITSVVNGATTGLQQDSATANNLLSQLAQLNQGLGQAPNNPALLDRQTAALNSLSNLLGFNVLPQSNGAVFIASGGTMLLDQSGAQNLTLLAGAPGSRPQITVGNAASPLNPGPAEGSIGANLQIWQSGNQALQALNGQASIVAANINQAQAQGLTGTGLPGGALFSVPAPSVAPAPSNSGTASLAVQLTNAGQLPASGGPFTLSFSAGAGWSASDQASGQTYTLGSGPNLAFAGLTLAVSGSPAGGDRFTINPSPGAASSLAVSATNPQAIAAADPYVVTPGAVQADGSILNSNGGHITAGADNVTTTPATGAAIIPASYYGQTLQLSFTSASAYNVSSTASPGTVIASGSLTGGAASLAVAYPPGAAAGQFWQVPLSGTASSGDVLTIAPGGNSSGSNASRMASLWTAPATTVSGSLQQSVAGLAAALGGNAQQAQQHAAASAAQVTNASNNLQTISGVSLDQQAVVLTGYSQAYQAAAQVISTAHTMFESLLQAI